MNRKAVYAGSFDPITNGHMYIVNTAAAMFDELVIAIGNNPSKISTFHALQRVELIQENIKHLNNVTVYVIPDFLYLVDYAKMLGANYLVRGLRSPDDFTYERGLTNFNRGRTPEITTIFLMPPPELADISSSMVKSLIGMTGWEEAIKPYVPSNVAVVLGR